MPSGKNSGTKKSDVTKNVPEKNKHKKTKTKLNNTEPLAKQAKRWNDHIQKKWEIVKTMPSVTQNKTTATTTTTSTTQHQQQQQNTEEKKQTKKRKITHIKASDTKKARKAITLANSHAKSELEKDDSVTTYDESELSMSDSHISSRKQKVDFMTGIESMEEFHRSHPQEANTVDPIENQTRPPITTIAGFQQLESLKGLMDKASRYWETFNKNDPFKDAHAVDEISYQHIRKILWAVSDGLPYKPCSFAVSGLCVSQTLDDIKHPLSGNSPCMGYYTPKQLEAISHGHELPDEIEPEICEFCYRFIVGLKVERGKRTHQTHEKEIPSRYYKTGPGEYSKEGMYYPTNLKKTQHVNGILGNMRIFNTSDFVCVVGIYDKNQHTVIQEFDLPEYTRDKLRIDSLLSQTKVIVYGWRETKPLHHLNDNAFFEVNQIDPYVRVISTTAKEINTQTIIEDRLEKRTTGETHPVYSNIFLDLIECARHPEIRKEAASIALNGTILGEHLTYCYHKYTEAPEPEKYSIYYTCLIKLHCMSDMIDKNNYPWSQLSDKLGFLIESLMPLAKLFSNKILSDEELHNETMYDPELGDNTPLIFALYPRPKCVYSPIDYTTCSHRHDVFSKANVIDVLADFYWKPETKKASERKYNQDICSIWKDAEQYMNQHGSTTNADNVLARIKKRHTEYSELIHRMCDQKVWTLDIIDTSHESEENIIEKAKKFCSEFISVHRKEVNSYNYVLGFVRSVFCDFRETVEFITSGMTLNMLTLMIQSMHNFRNCFPSEDTFKHWVENIVKKPEVLKKYNILTAILLRVHVSSELHSLEDVGNKAIRHALHLFRNDHIKMFRKILNTEVWANDDDIVTSVLPSNPTITSMRVYYPNGTREIHPGILPDHINSLTKVDFITSGGMSEHPWVKIISKLADRCCDTREFANMIQDYCKEQDEFYKIICLVMELSLKGLYDHCQNIVPFGKAVILDEIFDNSKTTEIRQQIIDLFTKYPKMISDTLGEYLCYMLDKFPSLKTVLLETYGDWFGWRSIADMDVIRYCYGLDGNLSEAYDMVYSRIRLNSNKVVYRNVVDNFIDYMCNAINNADKCRYSNRSILFDSESPYRLTYEDKYLIECVIRMMDPSDSFDASNWKIIGLTDQSIGYMTDIYHIFRHSAERTTNQSNNTQQKNAQTENFTIKPKNKLTPSQKVQDIIGEFDPRQYNLISYFFLFYKRYQNVTAMKITNLNILKQQAQKLCELHKQKNIEEVPVLAYTCVVGLCCDTIKTQFPPKMDSDPGGNDEVYYNIKEGIFVCDKPNYRSNNRPKQGRTFKSMARGSAGKVAEPERITEEGEPTLTSTNAIRPPKQDNQKSRDTYEKRIEKRQDEEGRKPACGTVEVLEVNLLGKLLAMNNSKPPKSPSVTDIPPFWINPCCARLGGYNFEGFYPNGYACGSCSIAKADKESLEITICSLCKQLAPKFKLVRVYDNIRGGNVYRSIVCLKCFENWGDANYSADIWPLSALIKGCKSIAIVQKMNVS